MKCYLSFDRVMERRLTAVRNPRRTRPLRFEQFEDRALLAADYLLVGDTTSPIDQNPTPSGLGTDNIKRFDAATGALIDTFVKPGQLSGERGMVYYNGNLIVANQNIGTPYYGEILKYDGNTGALISALVPKTDVHAPWGPRGIVIKNNILYVADTGDPNPAAFDYHPGRIARYDASTGAFISYLNLPTQSGVAQQALGVVFGPDGYLYVTTANELRTKTPDDAGWILRCDVNSGQCAPLASNDGDGIHQAGELSTLRDPEGIVFGPSGNLYVVSSRSDPSDTDKILVLNPQTGALLESIDLDQVGFPRSFAQSIIFGQQGKLYVPDEFGGGVRTYDPVTKTWAQWINPGTMAIPDYLVFSYSNPATLGYVSLPEIKVTVGPSDLASGSGYNLGTTLPGTPITKTFTVTNDGYAPLTLSPLNATGLPAGITIVANLGAASLNPQESTTFQVRLDATALGNYQGTLSFGNNDADENPFTLTLKGTVGVPEITVKDGTTNLVDGQTVNFGSKSGSANITKTFTIFNDGSFPLSLSPLSAASLPAGFTLVSNIGTNSLSAGQSTTLVIRLNATSAGTYSGPIALGSNDADENPFDLVLQGTVIAPEITLQLNAVNLTDGQLISFGTTVPGTPSIQTFRVVNDGTAPLTLTNLNAAAMPVGFSLVSNLGSTSLAPGGSTTFSIRLDAADSGTFSGSIALTNNDGDENPFDLSLSGIVVDAQIVPPQLTPGPQPTTVHDQSGALVYANWASIFNPSQASGLQVKTSCDDSTLFAVEPSIDANGTLTFTPAANAHGVAHVQVRLQYDDPSAPGTPALTPPLSFAIPIAKLHPWHNALHALDVTNSSATGIDGTVVAGDALSIINYINTIGAGPIPANSPYGPPYLDTTSSDGSYQGDDYVAAGDALAVINFINANGAGHAGPEGEASFAGAAAIDELFFALGSLQPAPAAQPQSQPLLSPSPSAALPLKASPFVASKNSLFVSELAD